MLGGRKITATCIGEKLEGSVAKCFPQRGILLPLLCCLIVDEVIEEMDGNDWYTLQYVLFSSAKNSQILPYSFFRRLRAWNNNGMVKLSYPYIHRRFSTWINILWNQVTQTKSVSRTLHFVQCMGLICMNIRAEKKRLLLKGVSHNCAQPSCILFRCILCAH